jgi:hypothetical protein
MVGPMVLMFIKVGSRLRRLTTGLNAAQLLNAPTETMSAVNINQQPLVLEFLQPSKQIQFRH